MNLQNKTYWLIGASEGLGEALACALDEEGAHLILSARNQNALETLAAKLQNARAVPLDVTDEKSIEKAKTEIGTVDGLIYIAGTYDPVNAKEWDEKRVQMMFDVNLIGATRILGKTLPEMVARNQGHIVLIGSLAGYQGLPGAIGYGASKAALMHLGQNLYCDLQDTNIKVQVINPGYIKTRLTSKNTFKMPQMLEPKDAATRTLNIMKSKRFMVAYPSPFKWIFILGRFLPYKLFAKFFR